MCKTCKTCFSKGTLVRNGKKLVAIEKIESVIESITNSIAEIHFGKHCINVTPNHLVKVKGKGYVQVSQLEVGCELETVNGGSVVMDTFVCIKSIDMEEKVYTLDMGGSDIVVSEKAVLFADYTTMKA